MGRIVVTEYVSVDGVVEAPTGMESFERVGWTDTFRRGPEGDAFKLDETMASDALLPVLPVRSVTRRWSMPSAWDTPSAFLRSFRPSPRSRRY